MAFALPKIRVGDPIRHEALSVFPLFADSQGEVEYLLADVALAEESIIVEEISESGSVPNLMVENKGDVRVLFLEGEELVGAKQNRILNTSVLVPAHSKIPIPVSCVEQGRWHYKSQHFGLSGSHSPSTVRHALKSSVSMSVKAKQGHKSDQGKVWDTVACLAESHEVDTDTVAMSDCFDTHIESIETYRKNIEYFPNAVGLAVAVGERVVSLDVFDKPATCEKVWNRLLTGVVFDAMQAGSVEKFAEVSHVEHLLNNATESTWEPADAVGEGEEYRAESSKGDHASALALENTVVHGSVVSAV